MPETRKLREETFQIKSNNLPSVPKVAQSSTDVVLGPLCGSVESIAPSLAEEAPGRSFAVRLYAVPSDPIRVVTISATTGALVRGVTSVSAR